MFSNLKKKIESEVGDLSRLAPSTVLNRTSNSSTLSSRHASISSLVSEPTLPSTPETTGGPAAAATPTSARSFQPHHHQQQQQSTSLNQIKIKQLEEKLQAQESDFAWRLSTKDNEILQLNKTVDILTAEIKDKENDVKRRLCRVQEDIDEIEGFSQQENAKLKHLLLNKEEELGRLRGDVLLKGEEIERVSARVRELESENERVRVSFEKLSGAAGGSAELEKTIENLQREVDVHKRRREEEERLVAQLRSEQERSKSEWEGRLAEERDARERLENELRESGRRVTELSSQLDHKSKLLDEVRENENEQRGSVESELEQLRRSLKEVESEKQGLLANVREMREGEQKMGIKFDSELELLNLKLREMEIEKGELLVNASENQNKTIENLRREVKVFKSSREEEEQLVAQLRSEQERCRLEWEGRLAAAQDQERNSRELLENELRESHRRVTELSSELNHKTKLLEKVREREEKTRGTLESELEQLRGSLRNVEVEKEELRATLESELEQLRRSLSDMEVEKEELLVNASENQNKTIQNLQREVEVHKGRREEEEKMRVTLELEVKQLRGSLGEMEADNEKLRVNASENQKRIQNLQREVEGHKRRREEEEKMRVAFESEVKQLRKSLGEMEADNEKLRVNVSENQKSIENLQREVEGHKRRREEEESMVAQFKNEKERIGMEWEGRLAAAQTEERDLRERLENELRESQRRVTELSSELDQKSLLLDEVRENEELREKFESELEQLRESLREVEVEKEELLVNVSEMQEKVDELEEECRFLREGRDRVKELEGVVQDNEKQLRQQSQALADLRRSLAKELSSKEHEQQQPQQPVHNLHANGLISSSSSPSSSSSSGGNNAAATLPQYETDVNFMYLRSVLFKYLTSQDPQITAHLTRVVATLLHLTEEETNTLISTTESRNTHLLGLIK